MAKRSIGARALLVLGVVGGALAVVAGCSETNQIGPGGDCFLATDCAPGLACIPEQGGRRVCSADLSGIVSMEDGGGGDQAAPPMNDSGGSDVTRDTQIADQGTPDMGTPETETPDTGSGDDAGSDDAPAE